MPGSGFCRRATSWIFWRQVSQAVAARRYSLLGEQVLAGEDELEPFGELVGVLGEAAQQEGQLLAHRRLALRIGPEEFLSRGPQQGEDGLFVHRLKRRPTARRLSPSCCLNIRIRFRTTPGAADFGADWNNRREVLGGEPVEHPRHEHRPGPPRRFPCQANSSHMNSQPTGKSPLGVDVPQRAR